MESVTYRALVVRETEDHEFVRLVEEVPIADLPEGDLLVQVHYSSLNYKDALSATGHRGVTKRYPHTPGIDAAGYVEQSASADFVVGDEVLVSGYDLGMDTPGGFGEYIRVPADWVVRVPETLSIRECMMYGTAGFTAGLSIFQLQQHEVNPEDGEILVTGATGGVGSLAVALLAASGYAVTAATGKLQQHEYLTSLGAANVIPRSELIDTAGKPLLSGRWAGVVDTVGGNILATAIKSTLPYGYVATCGNAASGDLPTTVYPFILRGVSLLGIASANCPLPLRKQIWHLLGGEWTLENLEEIAREVSLENLDPEIDRILQGQQVGRVVVSLVD